MLDQRTPTVTAESIRTEKIDAPPGADTLRIELVTDDPRQLDVLCIVRVFWPDGTRYRFPVQFETGGKVPPMSQRRLPRPLEGAKVEAQAFSLDGPAKLSVRTTCGTAETMPARLEKTKLDGGK